MTQEEADSLNEQALAESVRNEAIADEQRAIREAVAAERKRWRAAFPAGPQACACSGCPHERNCRCDCPECMVADVRAEEREACAKVAENAQLEDTGNWQARELADRIAAAIRARP